MARALILVITLGVSLGVWPGAVLADTQASAAASAQPLRVRFPYNVDPDPVYQRRDRYVLAMLKLALERSGEDYELEPVSMQTVNSSRVTRNVAAGHYDISWMHTNSDREKTLRPVKVPLFKGLIGWRLLLVSKEDLPVFATIDSPAQLKRRVAGQGHTWPDTEILRHSGYRVETSVNYGSLISMLKGGRIDYFPRSIIEIWDELAVQGIDNSLMVEPHLAMVYPSAYYLFVRPDDDRLHTALSRGFARARAVGAFDALFYETFGNLLERADLEGRHVFHLDNPMLDGQLPDDPALWFKPGASNRADDPS